MVAVVTGANTGVGFAMVQILAEQGTSVLLTARSVTRGVDAVRELLARVPDAKVGFAALDVLDPAAAAAGVAEAARELLGRDAPQPVALLVNNAGIAGDLPWEEVPEEGRAALGERILSTNFQGLHRVTEALQPLLAREAAVIHVTAGAAFTNMNKMTDTVLTRLREAQSSADLENMAKDFLTRYAAEGVKLHELDALSGFYMDAYGFSKALVNRLTEIHAVRWPDLRITCCSPGLCATNMTRQYERKEDLADVVEAAHVALRAQSAASGRFVGKLGEREAVPCLVIDS